jgi:hypothetical protein
VATDTVHRLSVKIQKFYCGVLGIYIIVKARFTGRKILFCFDEWIFYCSNVSCLNGQLTCSRVVLSACADLCTDLAGMPFIKCGRSDAHSQCSDKGRAGMFHR